MNAFWWFISGACAGLSAGVFLAALLHHTKNREKAALKASRDFKKGSRIGK